MTSPAMTAMGMILGTATYMSPEQARGKAVDKRADIWAFGCVLYEMLAGRRVFGGDSVTDTLAKVIEREPDWAALPASTPPHVRGVIERCLRKDPSRRLRDIGDARMQLEEGVSPVAAVVPESPARSGWRVPAIVAAAVVAGIAVGWVARTQPATAGDAIEARATGPALPDRLRAVHVVERETGHCAGRLEGRVCRRWRRIATGLRAVARRVGVDAATRHRRRVFAGVRARRPVAWCSCHATAR